MGNEPAFVNDDESMYSGSTTNRPPLDDSSATSNWRLNHQVTAGDITSTSGVGGVIRNSLRHSTTSGDAPFDGPRTGLSASSGSSASIGLRANRSPPRTVPFDIDQSSIAGTPIADRARILTEHTFRQVGIQSADSESSGEARSSKRAKRQQEVVGRKEGLARAWQESNMETDDPESRAKFNQFLESRKVRLQDENEFEPIRPTPQSPNNGIFADTQPLANTPTMERVAETMQKDLRVINSSKTGVNSRLSNFDVDVDIEDNISTAIAPSPSSFYAPPSTTPLRDTHLTAIEEDIGGAFEFSDPLQPQYQDRKTNSVRDTPSSTRTGSSISRRIREGSTSSIPATFNPQHFPETFHRPPGSLQLTRIYQEFDQRPGTMLTVNDLLKIIKDPSYRAENVSVIISQLVGRKYLKKVGNHDAWVIRRY